VQENTKMPDDIPQYEFSAEEELQQRMERAKARALLAQQAHTVAAQRLANGVRRPSIAPENGEE
jgi:hypothetical protein